MAAGVASDQSSNTELATLIWLFLSCTVAVGALTSLYTAGLLPLTALTLSLVGFCTHPTAVCAAILISPGPGADILRGVPKSFHSRTRVNAFEGQQGHVPDPPSELTTCAACRAAASTRTQASRD